LAQLVLDRQDEAARGPLEALGIRAVLTESIMGTREREIALARAVMAGLG
jgi:hypothetical protein